MRGGDYHHSIELFFIQHFLEIIVPPPPAILPHVGNEPIYSGPKAVAYRHDSHIRNIAGLIHQSPSTTPETDNTHMHGLISTDHPTQAQDRSGHYQGQHQPLGTHAENVTTAPPVCWHGYSSKFGFILKTYRITANFSSETSSL
jgi:hypothetical protein